MKYTYRIILTIIISISMFVWHLLWIVLDTWDRVWDEVSCNFYSWYPSSWTVLADNWEYLMISWYELMQDIYSDDVYINTWEFAMNKWACKNKTNPDYTAYLAKVAEDRKVESVKEERNRCKMILEIDRNKARRDCTTNWWINKECFMGKFTYN